VILSVEQHRDVLAALEQGDVEKAAAHLEENWRVSQHFLVPWIRTQGATPATRKAGR
jgi:DNA-binding GntR family transcriptional regulator